MTPEGKFEQFNRDGAVDETDVTEIKTQDAGVVSQEKGPNPLTGPGQISRRKWFKDLGAAAIAVTLQTQLSRDFSFKNAYERNFDTAEKQTALNDLLKEVELIKQKFRDLEKGPSGEILKQMELGHDWAVADFTVHPEQFRFMAADELQSVRDILRSGVRGSTGIGLVSEVFWNIVKRTRNPGPEAEQVFRKLQNIVMGVAAVGMSGIEASSRALNTYAGYDYRSQERIKQIFDDRMKGQVHKDLTYDAYIIAESDFSEAIVNSDSLACQNLRTAMFLNNSQRFTERIPKGFQLLEKDGAILTRLLICDRIVNVLMKKSEE